MDQIDIPLTSGIQFHWQVRLNSIEKWSNWSPLKALRIGHSIDNHISICYNHICIYKFTIWITVYNMLNEIQINGKKKLQSEFVIQLIWLPMNRYLRYLLSFLSSSLNFLFDHFKIWKVKLFIKSKNEKLSSLNINSKEIYIQLRHDNPLDYLRIIIATLHCTK